MVKNVSKQTVTVLFFLTIVVMLAGTLTVYMEVQNSNIIPLSQARDDARGEMSITIEEPPRTVSQTADVSINIVDNNGGQE